MAIGIGDSSSMYDIYSNSLNSQSSSKLEGVLSQDLSDADDTELLDACKQFESYFIEQVFKEMKNTIPESGLYEKSETEEYFGDMLTQEYASMATESGGVGLAQTLYEQMKKNYT